MNEGRKKSYCIMASCAQSQHPRSTRAETLSTYCRNVVPTEEIHVVTRKKCMWVRRKRNVRSNESVHVFSFVPELSTEECRRGESTNSSLHFFPIASHNPISRHTDTALYHHFSSLLAYWSTR